MAKQIFSTLLITLMLLSGVAMFAAPAFANHVCIGDPEADAGIDSAIGHACVSANSGGGKTTTFSGLLGKISSAINSLVPFIIGLAVFVIIWGIFNYIVRAADEEKRADARKYIVWGIIGVFFMLSIWGFVNILLNSLNLDLTIKSSDIPRVPTIGGTAGGNNDPGNNNGNNGSCPPGFDCGTISGPPNN